MSKRLTEIWHKRLEDWARWTVSGGRLSGGVSCVYRDEWWLYPPQEPLPLIGEAVDTDTLVQALPEKQKDAIRARFVWTYPVTLAARARLLGIHPNTFAERIQQAVFRLEDMHQTRLRAVARMRASVRVSA